MLVMTNLGSFFPPNDVHGFSEGEEEKVLVHISLPPLPPEFNAA